MSAQTTQAATIQTPSADQTFCELDLRLAIEEVRDAFANLRYSYQLVAERKKALEAARARLALVQNGKVTKFSVG